jgi:hypothetical protein
MEEMADDLIRSDKQAQFERFNVSIAMVSNYGVRRVEGELGDVEAVTPGISRHRKLKERNDNRLLTFPYRS